MDNRGEDRRGVARRSLRKNDREGGEGKRREEGFRRSEAGDADRKNVRRDFRKDGVTRGEHGSFRNRDLGSIMDIDNEILHLIMRRAQMLFRLRRGGRLAPETEKILRTAWESKAARLARDSRLSRDMFVLLQSIEPLTRVEEEQGYYNLCPNTESVDIQLPAPSDTVAARCWLAVAAAAGQQTKISRVPLSEAVVGCVKAINQIGGQLWWEDNGDVQSRGGNGLLQNMDKVIHIGSDIFNLWLVIALCVGMPARLKMTGDSSLRFVDLAPLRRFLPQLGVRLTNVIPSQDGLPVRMECSGMMPGEISISEDIPEDFAAALVLAAPFWEKNVRFVLPDHSPRLLPLVKEVLSLCGIQVIHEGRMLSVEHGELKVPASPVVPMEPFSAAILLMLPGFNGGHAVLDGAWGRRKPFSLVEKILRSAGLNIRYGENCVECFGKERETSAPAPEVLKEVVVSYPELLPLCILIEAAMAHEGAKVALPELSEDERNLVTAFLAHCGVEEKEGVLTVSQNAGSGSWVAPSAQWAMAYALGAFFKPNLHLANPGVMTDFFPAFWNIYNTLPRPELKRKKELEKEDEKPARRRVIAHGVYGELPPETSAGDD